ncbi:EcsC family protein [Marinobacterium jannaschii]|uniref:EcsC family protein n=1 Tax=Marinobacterium jannaschii TaxID=64970 RepID=UPI0004888382|nr:EcsC family protein [Marinobacterium jannaschii]
MSEQLPIVATLKDDERAQLAYARQLLENPGLAARLSDLIGSPVEGLIKNLPTEWRNGLNRNVQRALEKALDAALMTIDEKREVAASPLRHKLMVGASGALGGAFGLGALAIELPISTTLILRSIADIARSEGEDLSDPQVRMACLEVFALGGRSSSDDGAESGYLAVRAALARAVSDASGFVASHKVAKGSTPVMVKLLSEVASRFGISVSQKAAAQAVPIVGGAGGALINTLFMDHFQDMARGHFIVRQLERSYGEAVVRQAYQSLPDDRDDIPA